MYISNSAVADTKLSPVLLQQLETVEPCIKDRARYYPCRVGLKDGKTLDQVYLVEAPDFKRCFLRERPEEIIPAIPWISPGDLTFMKDSPVRLPARFANEIYRAGESGMGYFLFTVVFSWWPRKVYVVSGLVDSSNSLVGEGLWR